MPAQSLSSAADAPGQGRITRPSNLPTPPTALIGRVREIAQICALLRRADIRLLTLTGPGGVGKTRLDLQVTADLVADFTDGVYFIDLAPIRDPNLVSGAIAQTLGVREIGSQPLLERLKHELRDKHMLLLLDNFEHLLDAAAHMAELLAVTARLKLLITSREVLHLRGEQEVGVPPLALPDPADLPALDQLSQYAAVALFMARAQASQPSFRVTPENAPAVVQVCHRLDGIPLAIELAAARVRMLTVEQIAPRLSERFRLLIGGSRTALPRQQTMRRTIAWSYDLLTEDERAVLSGLAVFAGGWTLEAAEVVCESQELRIEDRGWKIATPSSILDPLSSILNGLAALLDKSLLRQIEGLGGATRFVMLETIREYALERLEASGEAEQLRRQHAHYYLALESEEPDSDTYWGRVARDYDNLRSALAWSQTAAGDPEVALRLASIIGALWYHRGTRSEAIVALERTLNHPLGVRRTVALAIVHAELGQLLALTGNYAAAKAQYKQGLAIARELAETHLSASILERLGLLAREQGDGATAWARLSESLAIYREMDDAVAIATALNTLAEVAILDEDPARVEVLLAESRAVGQRVPADSTRLAWTLNHLGHAAQLRRAYDRAAQLHHESLELFQAFGDQHFGLPWAYHGLGESALGLGNVAEAAQWLAQGLALSETLSDQASIVWSLAGLGSTAALGEQPERAARLWGAAEAVRARTGKRLAPAARDLRAGAGGGERSAWRRSLHRSVGGGAGDDA